MKIILEYYTIFKLLVVYMIHLCRVINYLQNTSRYVVMYNFIIKKKDFFTKIKLHKNEQIVKSKKFFKEL